MKPSIIMQICCLIFGLGASNILHSQGLESLRRFGRIHIRYLSFISEFPVDTQSNRETPKRWCSYDAQIIQTYSAGHNKNGLKDRLSARTDVFRKDFLKNQKDQSTTKVTPYALPKFDEYGNISFSEEKKRLDYFAKELQAVADEPGYIIEYRTKHQKKKALARAKRARDYLVRVQGIDRKRIHLINGGYQTKSRIELRLGPVTVP